VFVCEYLDGRLLILHDGACLPCFVVVYVEEHDVSKRRRAKREVMVLDLDAKRPPKGVRELAPVARILLLGFLENRLLDVRPSMQEEREVFFVLV
jgi:hypothetical protein